MSEIVERGLRAGALGFSTSRTPIHKSKSGELVPGTNADRRRAVRPRRRAAPGGSRRVPVRTRPRARSPRRVAVDDRDGAPHRPHRQRQPQPTRRGARSVARSAGTARPGPSRRHPDRRPGRRAQRRAADVPRGQLQPARLPPGVRADRRSAARRARRRAARSGAAGAARRVAGPRQPVRACGHLTARPVVAGRRRRHRLRTARRGLDRRRRRTHRTPSDGSDHRPADRPRRPRDDPHAVLQLRLRRPVVHATRRTSTPAPGWGWPTPARTAA